MIGRTRGWAARHAVGGVDIPKQAAVGADGGVKRVRGKHQPLEEKHAGPVSDQAVALHLAEAEAAVAGSPLGRLAGEDDARAAGSGVDFVGDLIFFFVFRFFLNFLGLVFFVFVFRAQLQKNRPPPPPPPKKEKENRTMCFSFW